MSRVKTGWLLGWLLSALLLCGCSGVLVESKYEDGRIERVKLDQGESWSVYEDKPRYHSQKKEKEDLGIMLKKEATF